MRTMRATWLRARCRLRLLRDPGALKTLLRVQESPCLGSEGRHLHGEGVQGGGRGRARDLAGRLVGVLRAAGQHLGHERPHSGLPQVRASHLSMLPILLLNPISRSRRPNCC